MCEWVIRSAKIPVECCMNLLYRQHCQNRRLFNGGSEDGITEGKAKVLCAKLQYLPYLYLHGSKMSKSINKCKSGCTYRTQPNRWKEQGLKQKSMQRKNLPHRGGPEYTKPREKEEDVCKRKRETERCLKLRVLKRRCKDAGGTENRLILNSWDEWCFQCTLPQKVLKAREAGLLHLFKELIKGKWIQPTLKVFHLS